MRVDFKFAYAAKVAHRDDPGRKGRVIVQRVTGFGPAALWKEYLIEFACEQGTRHSREWYQESCLIEFPEDLAAVPVAEIQPVAES